MSNEEETVSVDELKMKIRIAKMKQKVKECGTKVCNFCKENKEMIIQITPVILAGTMKMYKIHCNKKEDRVKNSNDRRSIYDRRHNHYYITRRPLTANEWYEYDIRYDNGESTYDILSSMRLL